MKVAAARVRWTCNTTSVVSPNTRQPAEGLAASDAHARLSSRRIPRALTSRVSTRDGLVMMGLHGDVSRTCGSPAVGPHEGNWPPPAAARLDGSVIPSGKGTTEVGYEIDVLGVGKESKSGDAIALRWGNLHGSRSEQKVVLIDGGFQKTGEDVVTHIKKYYGTMELDAVVSTHPDQDHVNGLHVVLDQLTVKELWIHKPWEHNRDLAKKFRDGRVTDESIGRRLKENLDSAADLVAKAESKNLHIVEPFSGTSLCDQGQFRVLGPSRAFYESLIPEFDGMPQAKATLSRLLAGIRGSVERAMKHFTSTWGVDALDDGDTTSAKNNSSVITLLSVDGRYLLFTGDAGITALTYAAGELDAVANGTGLRFIQIPHHGSRRNVGPTILDRLVGKPVRQGETRSITAIASTAKKGEPKHPRKAVMNAFTHRGASALATRGKTIRLSHDAPAREGWTEVTADDYYWQYEDEE